MTALIPFKEGQYSIANAFLLTADFQAVRLHNPVLEIYKDRFGKKQISGNGLVRNALMISLLDDHDDLDLVLNLNEDIHYILKQPELSGGKIFSPDIRSTLHFIPKTPWVELSDKAFKEILLKAKFLSKDR
jgi:hypothetical protein